MPGADSALDVADVGVAEGARLVSGKRMRGFGENAALCIYMNLQSDVGGGRSVISGARRLLLSQGKEGQQSNERDDARSVHMNFDPSWRTAVTHGRRFVCESLGRTFSLEQREAARCLNPLWIERGW